MHRTCPMHTPKVGWKQVSSRSLVLSGGLKFALGMRWRARAPPPPSRGTQPHKSERCGSCTVVNHHGRVSYSDWHRGVAYPLMGRGSSQSVTKATRNQEPTRPSSAGGAKKFKCISGGNDYQGAAKPCRDLWVLAPVMEGRYRDGILEKVKGSRGGVGNQIPALFTHPQRMGATIRRSSWSYWWWRSGLSHDPVCT